MKAIAGLIKKECDYEQKHEDFMLSLFRPDTRNDAAARGTAPPRFCAARFWQPRQHTIVVIS